MKIGEDITSIHRGSVRKDFAKFDPSKWTKCVFPDYEIPLKDDKIYITFLFIKILNENM